MRLPFTPEQFLDVFRRYNTAVWPAQWTLLAIALVIAVLVYRDRPKDHRWVYGLLAVLWLWMAFAYHLAFFRSVNPAAVAFGAVFAVQGALFAWYAFHTRAGHVRTRSGAAGHLGVVLVAYALFVYPALGYMFGHRYPAAPTFGVPCPTTIFTLGIIVWWGRSIPLGLLAIPLAWSIIATSAATSLGMTEDYGLPIAAIATVVSLVVARRGGRVTEAGPSAAR
jgi:Family of unknown function (DUF6064)